MFLSFFENIRRDIGEYEHKENFIPLEYLSKQETPNLLVEKKYLRF